MQGGFILPGLAHQPVTLRTWRETFGFLAQPLRPFGEAFFQGLRLLETASLVHGAAPFRKRKAGAQPAFSSPINTQNRAMTLEQFARELAVPNHYGHQMPFGQHLRAKAYRVTG